MVRSKHVLVTAGPTQEPVDPVRFISNRSTGEMGYACARRARELGYVTTLISGPTSLCPPRGVRFILIRTVDDLRRALRKNFPKCDILIMSAAVSDYRLARGFRKKLKRKKGLVLKLASTPDLLKELARKKGERVIVGFSLETSNLLKNARKKIKEKNLDFIVANYLSRRLNPFGAGGTNVTIIDKAQRQVSLRRVTKHKVAERIFKLIEHSRA